MPPPLSRSATREAIRVQVCYTRYQVSFYLWQIGLVLKHCKISKYKHQDCSRFKRAHINVEIIFAYLSFALLGPYL